MINQQRIWRYLLPGLGLALLGTNIEAKPVVPESMAFSESERVHLPAELQAQGKWAAFKALWRELDAIKPIHLENTPPDGKQFIPIQNNKRADPLDMSYGYGYEKRAYYQALSVEQAKQFQKRLDNIFGKRIVSPQAKLLFRLTQLRIQEMSSAHRSLLSGYDLVVEDREESRMSRMSPPLVLTPIPPSLYLGNALDRIEFRAKILMALRAKDAIGEVAFASALDALQKDAKLALYLDTLTTTQKEEYGFWRTSLAILEPMDFAPSGKKAQLKDVDMQSIQAWEHAFQASNMRRRNDSVNNDPNEDKSAQALLQKLSSLRTTLEELAPLLAELER